MFKNRELFYNIFLTAVIKIPNIYIIIKWYFFRQRYSQNSSSGHRSAI
jgi:hypothetical protein